MFFMNLHSTVNVHDVVALNRWCTQGSYPQLMMQTVSFHSIGDEHDVVCHAVSHLKGNVQDGIPLHR